LESEEVKMSARVEIEYCTQCRWLLRAAWMAQELLTTFGTTLGEVALVPGTGGVFEVKVDGKTLFSRKEQGRFPESKELKQLVRDIVAPDMPLGHSEAAMPDT
jgi:selenoprotein W-related protein